MLYPSGRTPRASLDGSFGGRSLILDGRGSRRDTLGAAGHDRFFGSRVSLALRRRLRLRLRVLLTAFLVMRDRSLLSCSLLLGIFRSYRAEIFVKALIVVKVLNIGDHLYKRLFVFDTLTRAKMIESAKTFVKYAVRTHPTESSSDALSRP